MIKMLEDLLIEATTNPNVPGSLVAGLRKVVDAARASVPPPTSAPVELPPSFDSPEEYRVCVKEIVTSARTIKIGEVYPGSPGRTRHPDCWAPCDKDGWVDESDAWLDDQVSSAPITLHIERRAIDTRIQWRLKPSAIDEMAEQMKRWAEPTREDFDKAIDGMSEAMGVPKRWLVGQAQSEPTPALAVQEGGSHYKDMKIQPVEYIHANGLGYFEGNVVKYISRWRAKGGLQDLRKARHYLDLIIELEGDTK